MMRRVGPLTLFFVVGLSLPVLAQQSWDVRPLPWNFQNWVQAISWAATAIGVVSGIWVGILQRKNELKWKRTQAAKQLNDEMMADGRACEAMLMIDYPSGRPLEVPGIGSTPIDQVRLKRALTHSFDKEPVLPVDRFIRDAFDSFLYRIGAFEHYISRGLVEFLDVQHPVDYYIRRMDAVGCSEAVQHYISKYRFYRTKDFLEQRFKWKFPEWKSDRTP